MTHPLSSSHPRGQVLLDLADRAALASHERAAHEVIARQLAQLLEMDFGGRFDPAQRPPGPAYFVPSDVLDASAADVRGIATEQDLFGGVVAHPILASKAISHGLVDANALRPGHWSDAFAERVAAATLPGYAAFTVADARRAGQRLLDAGPVRVKPTDTNAGRGQQLATSGAELEAILQGLEEARLARCGLVLETNLSEVVTYSIGYLRVGTQQIAYYGSQQLTPDNSGELVYGGTALVACRGDLHALLQATLPAPVRAAASQALTYDEAARHCFPTMIASRRNYDVAQGRDAAGRPCSGVLEPSWRIGGASGAELAALRYFQAHPASTSVHAATVERYGAGVAVPADALVLFDGIDAQVGPITKYVTVAAHGHP